MLIRLLYEVIVNSFSASWREQHRPAPSSGCFLQAVQQSPRAEGHGVAAHEGCFVREPDEASMQRICLLFGFYLCFPTGIKLNNSHWQECILIPQCEPLTGSHGRGQPDMFKPLSLWRVSQLRTC